MTDNDRLRAALKAAVKEVTRAHDRIDELVDTIERMKDMNNNLRRRLAFQERIS